MRAFPGLSALRLAGASRAARATLRALSAGNDALAPLKRGPPEFLTLGYSVLLSDVDIVTLQNPFDHLHRDEDVEALSDGYDEQTAYGWDDVHDDPKMGWSRWAHTIRVFTLNSGLFYIRPNERTLELMTRITDRLNKNKEWDQDRAHVSLHLTLHYAMVTLTSPRPHPRIRSLLAITPSLPPPHHTP
ncbi:hypothetical protein TSOC_008702 [Tetrabaena socialis]|uniref:Nucleotide-diphospho-sugar transferase domain-containing protein n=1 Tax=Tetrabaena socialis TaxID=47790 RepID=A0A2J7ZXS7_9CHLO|nr:hypothetical protein TSOC_008702 [Tetrabaena socialis]|eukprot:PNH05073.1 hypothetical protein TSOC_008702 [Tetrabaena socialis]